ncbi:unnamed protein product [Cuscuta campestris]|uniref:NusB/RsmB/TIM44 domain-containing protein n=1 Tax=Cuscuta campestris TaxID=132261 RepID=A0A484K892_9ASTE|nr:unnamed protein product [Cuscuta campestris]
MPTSASLICSSAAASGHSSLVVIPPSSAVALKPQLRFIVDSFPKCQPIPPFPLPQSTAAGRRSSLIPLRSDISVSGAPGQSGPTFSTQHPKIDKSGRFCSPRAARELALMTLYASCLEGSDPVRLFERRLNLRREHGYDFDKEWLKSYNHMSFGGPPVATDTEEEADQLVLIDENESKAEAEVLAAPPKLVYSKLILSFTRKFLVAVAEKWDCHVPVIETVAPPNWKSKPGGRILEFSILHLAMSEITVLGTRHQIVINEAVDLAKRFCDGAAPRVINGCLRTFVKNLGGTEGADQILVGPNANKSPSIFA